MSRPRSSTVTALALVVAGLLAPSDGSRAGEPPPLRFDPFRPRPEVVARAEPVYSTFCSDIAHLGDVGAGQVGKAMNNFLMWVNGIALIEAVHPDVKSPVMTGQWEARLQAIQRGQGELDAFMEGIESYVTDVVGRLRSEGTQAPPRPDPPPATQEAQPPAHGEPKANEEAGQLSLQAPTPGPRTPTRPDKLGDLLHETFGFAAP